MNEEITFIYTDNEETETRVEMKIPGGGTWMDITERFVDFLRGLGYSISADQLSDHFYTRPSDD